MFSKVVELPLKSLQLTGLNPKHESWIEKIKAFITCSTLTAISIAVMIEICTTEEFTIFTITPKAETIVALSQVPQSLPTKKKHILLLPFSGCNKIDCIIYL